MIIGHKYSFLLLAFFLVVISCSKDPVDPVGPPGNGPEGYSQYGTPYAEVPETGDIVMYEINLRAFAPDNGLQGVTNQLNYLKGLGINTIWLMPIHPIGEINSVNSPYSVKDYLAVSSEYGTLDDLRALTDAAHEKGIAVMMDWVANHTAWDNEWIENEGWYTTNTEGEIVHPPGTNWLDVADLNFDNEDMRLAMIDAMEYWLLEANIDGYRCDYADGVPFDFWQQAIDSLEQIPNRDFIFLAEGARKDHFEAGFDLTFGWSWYSRIKDVFDGQSASGLFFAHNGEYNDVPAGKHILRFTTNHDESAWDATPMEIFGGKDGALAASAITIFMGGVPLIYGSQEVGREENVPFFSDTYINWIANPDMEQAYRDMLTFYGQSEAARRGTLEYYPGPHVFCFEKQAGDERLLVMVNVRDSTEEFNLPPELQNTSWTGALDGETVNMGSSVELEAFEYWLLIQ